MDILIIIISIIAVSCLGLASVLFENKRLSTKNRALSTRNETLSTDLTKEEKKSQNLQIKLASAEDEIEDLKTDRAEVSQSNANAVKHFHHSQILLQTSVVAFHHEQKKNEQVIEAYQNLERMYKDLSETYNTTIEKSKSRSKRRVGTSILGLGAGLIPGGGTVSNLLQLIIEGGEAAVESSDILAAVQALSDVIENVEHLESISISMPDQDIDSISIALTEEGQNAFKAAFKQHLMDAEKLDPSNLTAFATEAHQHVENLDSLKSLTENEHYKRICATIVNLGDLGINYYDYHQAHKQQPAEKAPDLSTEV